MKNILNIALKKDYFEKLINGESNEIPIKKNDWWKKRLIDQDTGVYKKFDIASVTCGSTDKFIYDIERIELRGNKFIITVTPKKEDTIPNVEPGDSDFDEGDSDLDIIPEILDPVNVNSIVINNGISEINQTFTIKKDSTLETTDEKPHYILTDEQKKAIVEKYVNMVKLSDAQNETIDIKERVLKLLNSFCEQKDVFVVNMPNVTIRFNGQILGYHGGHRLIADRDSDVRIDFKKYELTYNMSDNDFIMEVNSFLNSLLKNNYVFINRNSCRFYTTPDGLMVFQINAVAKKKYLFK